MMRKILIKIHAYIGLFCVPYLLIFGISSLNFNHILPWIEKNNGPTVNWNENGLFPDSLDNESLARLINDSLGIMGWYIPWNAKKDSISF